MIDNLDIYKKKFSNNVGQTIDKWNWKDEPTIKQLIQYGFIEQRQIDAATQLVKQTSEVYEDGLWSIGITTWRNNQRVRNCTFLPNNYSSSGIRLHHYAIYVLCHIPFVEIKNSLGHHLPIRDMYIKIYINSHGHSLSVTGTRGTVSYEEFIARYQHSHLPSTEILGTFNNFCMGTGDYAQVMSRISGMLYLYDKSEDDIYGDDIKRRDEQIPANMKMLLFSLKEMLSWESLEGGPHIRMENIFLKTENGGLSNSKYIFKAAYDEFLRWWKLQSALINKGKAGENVSMRVQSGELVVDEPGLEKTLLIYINEQKQVVTAANITVNILQELLAKKDSSGKYYENTSRLNNLVKKVPWTVQSESFYFNNLLVTPYIDINAEEIVNQLYVNPNFTKYVRRKIEQTIRRKRVKDGVINRLKSTSHMDAKS
jgi:hypothetical protein